MRSLQKGLLLRNTGKFAIELQKGVQSLDAFADIIFLGFPGNCYQQKGLELCRPFAVQLCILHSFRAVLVHIDTFNI